MVRAPSRSLRTMPWAVRERLREEIRGIIVGHRGSAALAEILAGSLERFARRSRNAGFHGIAKGRVGRRALLSALKSWIPELPPTRMSEWLVDKLSEAAGIRWSQRPAYVPGPVQLPLQERDKILDRLESTFARSISYRDEAPDAGEYADIVDDELDRLARHYEAFAAILLNKRFEDRRDGDVSFRVLLDHARLTDHQDVIKFLETKLEIEWTEHQGSPRNKSRRNRRA